MRGTALALAATAVVAAGCAETVAQHRARLTVEDEAAAAGRAGDGRCTSDPILLFTPGPTASVFICIVRTSDTLCDRYIVRRRGRSYTARVQARDVDCILPIG